MKVPNEERVKPAGSDTISTDISPNDINKVEIREMYTKTYDTKDNKYISSVDSLRVFYGKSDSELTKSKELEGYPASTIDSFRYEWKDDNHVVILVQENINGRPIKPAMEIDFSK